MPELWFDPAADRVLAELASDDARRVLADRVDAVLDAIESEPGRFDLRRHRLMIGLWGVTVSAQGHDWIVLWEQHPSIAGAIVIHYVGPASFT